MKNMMTLNDEISSAVIAEVNESTDQITEAFNGGSHNTTQQRDHHFSSTAQLLYDTNTIDHE